MGTTAIRGSTLPPRPRWNRDSRHQVRQAVRTALRNPRMADFALSASRVIHNPSRAQRRQRIPSRHTQYCLVNDAEPFAALRATIHARVAVRQLSGWVVRMGSWARAKPQRGHWMIGYHSIRSVAAAAKAAMESGFPTPSAPSRPDGSEESAYGRLRAIRVPGYP